MKMTRKLSCFLVFIFLHTCNFSFSQQLNWGFTVGSSGEDVSNAVYTDAQGNVYKGGRFGGVNVDFDPGPGSFLMSSTGVFDAYVAKYTSSGQFLWAFHFGGSDRDNVNALTVDKWGNVIITGYFRGANVDFDPGPGTFLLTSNGESGGDPGYGGDSFLAKYDPNGNFLWAFGTGGSRLDNGLSVTTDIDGDIYVGGHFLESVDFDPGAGTAILNATTGSIFLSKYSASGNYQWAFNFGLGDADGGIFGLTTDASKNVAITGFFQGTNEDFDPGPGAALLSSLGGYECFIGKYNSDGQYLSAFSIGGSSTDVGRSLVFDPAGNLYLIGDFGGSIDIDPGAGVHTITSNGPSDVFVAKYSSANNLVWGFNFGGSGGEFGWSIASDGFHLFLTGGFTGSSDMDPSPNVDNLVSAGGYDIFLAKYSLDGQYSCSFKIGGTGDDFGQGTYSPATNLFYLTGSFKGTNVDFDPTAGTTILSSNGAEDAFLSKYYWADPMLPSGTLGGSSICLGEEGSLTFTAATGSSPFTMVYTDGINNFTATGIESGVPFHVQSTPAGTTHYSVVSITDGIRCSPINTSPNAEADIIVDHPVVQTIANTTICKGSSIILTTTGAIDYSWTPVATLSDPNMESPIATPAIPTRYIVDGTAASGCHAKDTVDISIFPDALVSVSTNTEICMNGSTQLQANGGVGYLWTPAASLDNPTSPSPVASPTTGTRYYVDITDNNSCHYIDSVDVSIRPQAVFSIAGPDRLCSGDSIQLTASGGDTYQWQPARVVDDPSVANPMVFPTSNTTFAVTVTDEICHYSQTLSKDVEVLPAPSIVASRSADLDCANDRSQLMATGAIKYQWTPAETLTGPNFANPIAKPIVTTDYIVKGTGTNGCFNYDTVTVKVGGGNDGLYLMPTGFTPNNDGKNDCYGIQYWGAIDAIDFSIYNRWGQLVFHSKQAGACWDGTSHGTPQPPDVYVYVIRASTNCDKNVFKKGTFVLIR